MRSASASPIARRRARSRGGAIVSDEETFRPLFSFRKLLQRGRPEEESRERAERVALTTILRAVCARYASAEVTCIFKRQSLSGQARTGAQTSARAPIARSGEFLFARRSSALRTPANLLDGRLVGGEHSFATLTRSLSREPRWRILRSLHRYIPLLHIA